MHVPRASARDVVGLPSMDAGGISLVDARGRRGIHSQVAACVAEYPVLIPLRPVLRHEWP